MSILYILSSLKVKSHIIPLNIAMTTPESWIAQYSKPAVYSILAICLCVIVAYIIVVVIISLKRGRIVWTQNVQALNIITMVAIGCSAIAALIIRFVPFVRYPITRALHRIPVAIDSILDSGSTPYFNPPVYSFKYGQYVRTDNIPYEMDQYGLPVVDQNVPLNSFNMPLFRKYHRADLVDLGLIRTTMIEAYEKSQNSNSTLAIMDKFMTDKNMEESLIDNHVATVFDTVMDITRIATVGKRCLVVSAMGGDSILIHKNKYLELISDPSIIQEIALYNKYKLMKHFNNTEKIAGIDWLNTYVLNGKPIEEPINEYNKYHNLYNELRVLYALVVESADIEDRHDILTGLYNMVSKLIVNDDALGLIPTMESMVLVGTINRCVKGAENYIMSVGKYLTEQTDLDMEKLYKYLLENDKTVNINSILRDTHEHPRIRSTIQSISSPNIKAFVDAISTRYIPLDIDNTPIKILLPYLEEV